MSAPFVSRRDAPVICAGCGRKVERRARQQRFCSPRCQEKARTRVRGAFLGKDTGAPGNPQKKNKNFKALQRAKLLSSNRIFAPRHIVDAEVWGGRTWQDAVSSGGVAIQISRIRRRALVSS